LNPNHLMGQIVLQAASNYFWNLTYKYNWNNIYILYVHLYLFCVTNLMDIFKLTVIHYSIVLVKRNPWQPKLPDF
jgi:hypothetical protein